MLLGQNCFFISQQLLYTLVGYKQTRFGHLYGHHQWQKNYASLYMGQFTTDDDHLNGRNAFGCNQLKCIKVLG
jgi:hypothetical protein